MLSKFDQTNNLCGSNSPNVVSQAVLFVTCTHKHLYKLELHYLQRFTWQSVLLQSCSHNSVLESDFTVDILVNMDHTALSSFFLKRTLARLLNLLNHVHSISVCKTVPETLKTPFKCLGHGPNI